MQELALDDFEAVEGAPAEAVEGGAPRRGLAWFSLALGLAGLLPIAIGLISVLGFRPTHGAGAFEAIGGLFSALILVGVVVACGVVALVPGLLALILGLAGVARGQGGPAWAGFLLGVVDVGLVAAAVAISQS